MRALRWLGVGLIAALLALFAASNREAVVVGLWPLPFVVDLPLYLVVLAATLIGFIAGAVCAWIGGARGRREARQRRRRLAAIEQELSATQAQLPGVSVIAPARPPSRG